MSIVTDLVVGSETETRRMRTPAVRLRWRFPEWLGFTLFGMTWIAIMVIINRIPAISEWILELCYRDPNYWCNPDHFRALFELFYIYFFSFSGTCIIFAVIYFSTKLIQRNPKKG